MLGNCSYLAMKLDFIIGYIKEGKIAHGFLILIHLKQCFYESVCVREQNCMRSALSASMLMIGLGLCGALQHIKDKRSKESKACTSSLLLDPT